MSIIASRRLFLIGSASLLAAPAIVHIESIMPVKLWRPDIWEREVRFPGGFAHPPQIALETHYNSPSYPAHSFPVATEITEHGFKYRVYDAAGKPIDPQRCAMTYNAFGFLAQSLHFGGMRGCEYGAKYFEAKNGALLAKR